MKQINSKVFSFQFFLSDKVKVNNLDDAAKLHGGATQIKNNVYSNIQGNEYIKINNNNNSLSLFVPDTIHDQTINNSTYVEYIINKIYDNYHTNNITAQKALGSWYSDDLQKVIYDNITIVNVILDNISEDDILLFIQLAEYIKKEMQQEGVTITINDALAII